MKEQVPASVKVTVESGHVYEAVVQDAHVDGDGGMMLRVYIPRTSFMWGKKVDQ